MAPRNSRAQPLSEEREALELLRAALLRGHLCAAWERLSKPLREPEDRGALLLRQTARGHLRAFLQSVAFSLLTLLQRDRAEGDGWDNADLQLALEQRPPTLPDLLHAMEEGIALPWDFLSARVDAVQDYEREGLRARALWLAPEGAFEARCRELDGAPVDRDAASLFVAAVRRGGEVMEKQLQRLFHALPELDRRQTALVAALHKQLHLAALGAPPALHERFIDAARALLPAEDTQGRDPRSFLQIQHWRSVPTRELSPGRPARALFDLVHPIWETKPLPEPAACLGPTTLHGLNSSGLLDQSDQLTRAAWILSEVRSFEEAPPDANPYGHLDSQLALLVQSLYGADQLRALAALRVVPAAVRERLARAWFTPMEHLWLQRYPISEALYAHLLPPGERAQQARSLLAASLAAALPPRALPGALSLLPRSEQGLRRRLAQRALDELGDDAFDPLGDREHLDLPALWAQASGLRLPVRDGALRCDLALRRRHRPDRSGSGSRFAEGVAALAPRLPAEQLGAVLESALQWPADSVHFQRDEVLLGLCARGLTDLRLWSAVGRTLERACAMGELGDMGRSRLRMLARCVPRERLPQLLLPLADAEEQRYLELVLERLRPRGLDEEARALVDAHREAPPLQENAEPPEDEAPTHFEASPPEDEEELPGSAEEGDSGEHLAAVAEDEASEEPLEQVDFHWFHRRVPAEREVPEEEPEGPPTEPEEDLVEPSAALALFLRDHDDRALVRRLLGAWHLVDDALAEQVLRLATEAPLDSSELRAALLSRASQEFLEAHFQPLFLLFFFSNQEQLPLFAAHLGPALQRRLLEQLERRGLGGLHRYPVDRLPLVYGELDEVELQRAVVLLALRSEVELSRVCALLVQRCPRAHTPEALALFDALYLRGHEELAAPYPSFAELLPWLRALFDDAHWAVYAPALARLELELLKWTAPLVPSASQPPLPLEPDV